MELIIYVLIGLVWGLYGSFVALQKNFKQNEAEFIIFTILTAPIIFISRVIRSPFHNFKDFD